MNILHLIANRNFITVNKNLIKKLGLEEAVVLGELASEFDYWEKNGKLVDGEYFFSTVENIEENTGLNDYKQRRVMNKLKSLNIIETVVKGLPAKRYIKINYDKLCEILEIQLQNNSNPSSEKIKELDTENFKSNNNNINNNKNNNNIKERKKESPAKTYAEQIDVPDKKKKSQTQNYNEIIDDYTENTELKDTLIEFIKMRKLNKKVMSNRALNMLLKKLNNYASTDKEKIQILENSILKSWQDIYPLSNEENIQFKQQSKKLSNSIPKDEETYKRMKQFEELGIGYDNEF